MKKIALIPARSGSKRIRDKNIKYIAGKPLIQHTLDLVFEMNFFDEIVVSTDSSNYADIVSSISKAQIHMRSKEISGDCSSDIEWVSALANTFQFDGEIALFILRPTSPLRSPEFIHNAWTKFSSAKRKYDSLRAITKVDIHPGKMWTISNNDLLPLYPFQIGNVPWHSNQTATLPDVYMQTASLEILWLETVTKLNSLSGSRIMPYICEGGNAIDINGPLDWNIAEHLLEMSH
jgi:CMP-N,N'-diacetyllegionaminic acid synthase